MWTEQIQLSKGLETSQDPAGFETVSDYAWSAPIMASSRDATRQDEILADSEGYTASVIFEIIAVAYSPNMAFVKNGDDIYEIKRVYRPDKSRFIQLTCEARNNGKD